jgi:hypothetical protein
MLYNYLSPDWRGCRFAEKFIFSPFPLIGLANGAYGLRFDRMTEQLGLGESCFSLHHRHHKYQMFKRRKSNPPYFNHSVYPYPLAQSVRIVFMLDEIGINRRMRQKKSISSV